jgi:lysophospholipase L1-like esterase
MPIPERYLALGDSFTIGTGTKPDRSFPAVLVAIWRERGTRTELRNPAVNGYTTDDLIRDELPLVASFRPTFATVLIGANDIVAASDDARYAAQLARIFAAPMGGAFGDRASVARTIERFNALMAEAAERARARYVDLFPLMRAQGERGMFAADGLHPSAEAYAEWARDLAARL